MRTSVFRGNLSIALAILAILAMLGSACRPSEAPPSPPAPAPPTPGGNQPPVISSLTAAEMQTHPTGEVGLQCAASDPDGDKITFQWACSNGSFGDTAPTSVTWKAPKEYGDYVITVTVEDGKGGTTQASLTLSVTANQNPQIVSLGADPKSVGPGGSSTITCLATDADGDKVSYSWSAGEGEVGGTGDKVTWKAPNKAGTYDVAVVVSDGRGGKTTGHVPVTVALARKTVTIPVVQEETGTVSVMDRDPTRTWAGDDEDNDGYRAFWSFNIFFLVGTEIEDAKLEFTTRSSNDEAFRSAGFGALGGLRLWMVNYGEGGLPKFDITGGKLDRTYGVIKEPPTVVDVTHEITHLVHANATRFQVEALFVKATNGNGVGEQIDWSEVTLTVTYTEK